MEIFEYKAGCLENFEENPDSNARVAKRMDFGCTEQEAAQK